MFKKEDFIFNEGFSLDYLYFYNLREDVSLVLESPSRSNLSENDICFIQFTINGDNEEGDDDFNIVLGRTRVSQMIDYLNENRKEIVRVLYG